MRMRRFGIYEYRAVSEICDVLVALSLKFVVSAVELVVSDI